MDYFELHEFYCSQTCSMFLFTNYLRSIIDECSINEYCCHIILM